MRKVRVVKRFMTLIEIMIVMTLIGIISGVIIYNLSGSVDKGKRFSTEQKAKQIKQVIMLDAIENQRSTDYIEENWKEIVNQSPLLDTDQKSKIFVDGWGKEFTIEIAGEDVLVKSPTMDKKW